MKKGLCSICLALILTVVLAGSARAERQYWSVREAKVSGQVRNALFGDFNGDSLQDMVVTHIVVDESRGTTIRWASLFLQNAEGYGEGATQSWVLDPRAVVVDVADVIPGNKGPELVYITAGEVRAYVFEGKEFAKESRTILSQESFFLFADTTIAPTFDFARDLDGDSIPEILLPARDGKKLMIFGRDAGSAYRQTHALKLPFQAEWGHHWENEPILNRLSQLELRSSVFFPVLFLKDFNADGLADLLFGIDDQLHVFLRKAGESLRFEEKPQRFYFPAIPAQEFIKFFKMRKIARIWVEDFNKDGRADVYLTEASIRNMVTMDAYAKAYIYLNKDGKFDSVPDQELEVPGLAETAWSADVTGDGYPDLIFQYFPFSLTMLMRVMILGSLGVRYALFPYNPETGKLTRKAKENFSVGFSFEAKANSAIWAAYLLNKDFNGDGRPDLMQATDNDELAYYLTSEDEWADDKENISVDTSFFVYSQDLNGDGRDDMVFRYESIPDKDGAVSVVLSRPPPELP